MTKLRVHEYAKQNNISSKDVMSKLKEMNIEVTNHMTTLDDTTIQKLNAIQCNQNKSRKHLRQRSTVEQYEAEADAKSTVNVEKLKKKPVQKPAGTGMKKPGQGQFNRGKNSRNKNKQRSHQHQHAPVQQRKERELPAKITFFGVLNSWRACEEASPRTI